MLAKPYCLDRNKW